MNQIHYTRSWGMYHATTSVVRGHQHIFVERKTAGRTGPPTQDQQQTIVSDQPQTHTFYTGIGNNWQLLMPSHRLCFYQAYVELSIKLLRPSPHVGVRRYFWSFEKRKKKSVFQQCLRNGIPRVINARLCLSEDNVKQYDMHYPITLQTLHIFTQASFLKFSRRFVFICLKYSLHLQERPKHPCKCGLTLSCGTQTLGCISNYWCE